MAIQKKALVALRLGKGTQLTFVHSLSEVSAAVENSVLTDTLIFQTKTSRA